MPEKSLQQAGAQKTNMWVSATRPSPGHGAGRFERDESTEVREGAGAVGPSRPALGGGEARHVLGHWTDEDGDDTWQSPSQPKTERAQALAKQGPAQRRSVFQQYVAVAEMELRHFTALRLGPGVRDKARALCESLEGEGLSDYHLEDLSAPFFENQEIDDVLNRLDSAFAQVSGGASDSKKERARALILDIIVAATLVPSREQRRFFTGHRGQHFARQSLAVLSPAKARGALEGIAAGFESGDANVHHAGSVARLDLKDGDSHSQRLLKLSLLNASDRTQGEMKNDRLFQSILQSPHITQMMMGGTGGLEQRFLNTCSATARNAQIGSHGTTIATMLEAGRNLLRLLEHHSTSRIDAGKREQALSYRETVGDRLKRRVEEGKTELQAIEAQALELVQADSIDPAKLEALRLRWSREMEKLAATLNWSNTKELPELSKKPIAGHWHASAALSLVGNAPLGAFRKGLRNFKRYRGIDESSYVQETGRYLGRERQGKPELLTITTALTVKTPAQLWEHFHHDGGAVVSTGGHSLYLEAIQRNGIRLFAINDPMHGAYEYYTLDEWPAWARRSGAMASRTDLHLPRPTVQTVQVVRRPDDAPAQEGSSGQAGDAQEGSSGQAGGSAQVVDATQAPAPEREADLSEVEDGGKGKEKLADQ